MGISLYAITVDCGNALALAGFWSSALGKAVDQEGTEEFASIGVHEDAVARPHMMFARVPEGKTAKNRIHLDLIAAGLDDEVDRLVRLGAKKAAEFDENGVRWVTLTDPEGNEFDVVAEQT
jgi:predicted enzyme related to lactoylglutathione lyase